MLKDTILSAVKAAETALGDLLIDVTVTRRTPRTHVPGAATQYDVSTFGCKMSIVDYDEDEVDGSRVLKTDQKGILLGDSLDTLKVNDIVDDSGSQYRVVHRKPYRVGSATAAVEIQLRVL